MLEHCILYSSFSGEIADVSVVPGGIVASGDSVAAIQMMNPIKIELEVSAEESRILRQRQRIPVLVTQPDSTVEQLIAILYLIDHVADPQTRTYTMTLLLLNKKTSLSSVADDDDSIATTDSTWRVDFSFLPGAEQGMTFAGEDYIYEDQSGHFVWRVENIKAFESLPADRLAKVSKLRVEL